MPTSQTAGRLELAAKAMCADMGYEWDDQSEDGVGCHGNDPRLPSRQDFRDAASAAINAWEDSKNGN